MKNNVIMLALLSALLFACSKTESSVASTETKNNGAKIAVSPAAAPATSAPVTSEIIPLSLSTKLAGFDSAKPNQILDIPILISNKGDTEYNDPTNISYHWFDASGKEIVHDGERTALKLPIPVGAESEMTVRVYAPKNSGAYVVQVDLVKEGQYWFADKGMTPIRLPVEVKASN